MNTLGNASIGALMALVRKDFTLFFSNKRALIITIAAPILIAAFFGTLMAPGSAKLSKVAIAMIDLDHSLLSQKIVTAMADDGALAVSSPNQADAIELVRKGKISAAIVLPKGFGTDARKAFFAGAGSSKPQVTIQYDPSQSMVLGLVRGVFAQHVMETVAQSVFSANNTAMSDLRADLAHNTSMPLALKQEINTLYDSIAKVQSQTVGGSNNKPDFSMPFSTSATEVTSEIDKKYNSYAQSFAGMSVQFILFMGIDFGVGLLLARRMGLWKRLRAAPISRRLLIGSGIVSCTMIAIMVMCVIYAVALAFFGVRIEGSIAGFIGVMGAFGFLTATFGLLIAAIGKTPEATRGLATLATLLMVMLGGAWVPSFVFPEWLQTISLAVPTRWAIDGLAAMTWRGLGFEAAMAPIGVMLAFSAVFAVIAIWRFDWEE